MPLLGAALRRSTTCLPFILLARSAYIPLPFHFAGSELKEVLSSLVEGDLIRAAHIIRVVKLYRVIFPITDRADGVATRRHNSVKALSTISLICVNLDASTRKRNSWLSFKELRSS
jgi:hypothetical protein